MDIDELLNTQQVAARLGFSISTVNHWRRINQGPEFIRIGPRRIRYTPEAIQAFLDGDVSRGTEGDE